jgi:hypothetical protein
MVESLHHLSLAEKVQLDLVGAPNLQGLHGHSHLTGKG